MAMRTNAPRRRRCSIAMQPRRLFQFKVGQEVILKLEGSMIIVCDRSETVGSGAPRCRTPAAVHPAFLLAGIARP